MAKFSEIINEDLPVLVDFHADWCGPCKLQSPLLNTLAGELKGRARILKIDVDKNPNVSIKYGVRSIPTLILFRKGEVIWRHVGLVQLEQLRQIFTPE
ncbi:MAG: thioredoxin [Cyclobacteriaceae bacterium]|nr:thioredoxin [Cyclobacteriaceae bacterium]